MTSTRYMFCIIEQAFGYRRKNIRMGDAAEETHLLKEAESHLGKAIWQDVESIEALSLEYWNLRKLIKERDRVATELDGRLKSLSDAHEERASLLGVNNEPYKELRDERQIILNSLEKLTRERDIIVAKARDIRRAYDGAKTKEEVLSNEGDHAQEEFADITKRLAQLKSDFSVLKAERNEILEKITQGDAKVDAIEAEIEKRKKERRGQASEAFQHIGDANQEISTLRAELGVLDTQMRQLYTEIGKYVSRNGANDPECRTACHKHQGLVDVMGALRKSILLNHKLADFG